MQDMGKLSGTTATALVLPSAATPTGDASSGPVVGGFSITLPWPPKGISHNGRGNWQKRARLVKLYRKTCADQVWQFGVRPGDHSLTLSVVTFCPPDNRARDKSNMIDAFKAGQDGIADALGVDDRHFDPAYQVGPAVPGGAVQITLTAFPHP